MTTTESDFPPLEKECKCQGLESYCFDCHGRGIVPTEFGMEVLRFVKKNLVPDSKGDWDLEQSRHV